MRKLRVLDGSMPVFFARWEYDHFSHGHNSLFRLRSHNPLSGRDYQNLIPIMAMEFVPHTSAKIHDAYA
jgi:hypothetical protein